MTPTDIIPKIEAYLGLYCILMGESKSHKIFTYEVVSPTNIPLFSFTLLDFDGNWEVSGWGQGVTVQKLQNAIEKT